MGVKFPNGEPPCYVRPTMRILFVTSNRVGDAVLSTGGMCRHVQSRDESAFIIGTETGMTNLADCSVVVAPYEIDGERAGSIGLLGSTRMNYPQALAAVWMRSRS